jgi:hypothetical protein
MSSTAAGHVLLWALYPAWLVAGLVDYVCHRRTHIETTSGLAESAFHLAQFLSLGIPLALAAWFEISPLVLAILVGGVVVHSWLSFADVSFTDGRRRISPLEQHAHGFMTVLPIVALGAAVLLYQREWQDAGPVLRPRNDESAGPSAAWLIASFFVLAGTPIVEELIRCSRRLRDH